VLSDRGSLAMIVSVGSAVVSGTDDTIQRPADVAGDQPSVPSLRLRRIPPIFLADKWNVHNTTVSGVDQTNNFSEGWNNDFRQLVGHNHPGVWRSIECFRLDQSVVATQLLQQARGQLPSKRVCRCTLQMLERLQKLCVSIRDGGSDTAHFLRAVGHTVRLCKE